MKNNYPIRYAVIPMYEQTGWIHGLNQLERDYNAVAYIVSKCYLINETKEYLSTGKTNYEYEIVFPFEKNDIYDNWVRTEPHFSCVNKCTNSIKVDNIFDNYADAVKLAEEKNNELLIKKASFIPYNNFLDQIEEEKAKHNEIIDKYKSLEKKIIEFTQDLNINEISKEQTIITISSDKQRFIDIPLYNYINFCDREQFCIYSISKEDYEVMKKQIKENGSIDKECCDNGQLIMTNDISTQTIRIIDNNSNNNGSFYLKNGNMYYSNNIQFNKQDTENQTEYIKIYTTETYEDIIKSFIPRYIEEQDAPTIKIDNAIIGKKLVLKNN